MDSTDAGRGNSVADDDQENSSANTAVMFVMMVEAITIEEQLANLTKLVKDLVKRSAQHDLIIAQLMSKNHKSNQTAQRCVQEARKDNTFKQGEKPDDSSAVKVAEKQSQMADGSKTIQQKQTIHVSADGFISTNELRNFIEGMLNDKNAGNSKSSSGYSKPYSRRIESLKMPVGYLPPKLQQFDGRGDPKQHIAHFVETCNNAGTDGDLLVKQFVRSLKGSAFDWYTDLLPGSINSWSQLEVEFLNRFYSTRRTVSMLELSHTKQWKDESVIDYINRWRSINLNCRDRLCEKSAIEMCVQGMHWNLQYILKGIQPKTFEELATRGRDMELSIIANQTLEIDVECGSNIASELEDEESVSNTGNA